MLFLLAIPLLPLIAAMLLDDHNDEIKHREFMERASKREREIIAQIMKEQPK